MFYFENYYGKKVLKSDLLEDVTHFFTTRDCADFSKLNPKRLIRPEQTHSDHVEFADERNEYPDTDGIILTEQNDACCLKFADCTPLIFFDTKNKIGAVSHAGWRGTAKKIGIKTLQKMNSNPNDIVAIIGPAISLCCYEVSDDVKTQLLNTVENNDKLSNDNYVDLKLINARQLQEFGVSKIDICPYCTSCNNDLFYSYRKENGTTNRHFAILKI